MALTIGGLPGSGTTTVAKLLKEKLGIKYVYTGDIFRNMARERGMSLLAFGDYAANHPDIDRELDRKQVELAKQKDIIIEGRLAGYMAHSHNVEAYKIWLHAPFEVRMERIANRETKSISEVSEENRRREEGEQERYIEIYGFNIDKTSFYNIDIDSSLYSAERIKNIICLEVNKMNSNPE